MGTTELLGHGVIDLWNTARQRLINRHPQGWFDEADIPEEVEILREELAQDGITIIDIPERLGQ